MRHHAPRKRFGQNFLTDQSVIDRIVDAVEITAGTHVVEIGPGRAALTLPLLKALNAHQGSLTVVEIDRDLAADLPLRLLGESQSYLNIVQQDGLTVDFSSLRAPDAKRFHVVGNLPYNVSTPLLFHLLSFAHSIDRGVFMLQREVVDRICAAPGSKDYGRLSVMMQYYAAVRPLINVPPGAFYPPPKVHSAVFAFEPYSTKPICADDEAVLASVVRDAFGQRRKMLRAIFKNRLLPSDFEQAGVAETQRAENLSLHDFVTLSNVLAAKEGAQQQA